MKKTILIIAAICMFYGCDTSAGDKKLSAQPPKGFVPDEQTAMKIAEAVWIPIYGNENIEKQKPFQVKLEGDTWVVEGTLPQPKGVPTTVGGVAIAEISKKDGRILRVSHGK